MPVSSTLYGRVQNFTVGQLDESDHFPISAVVCCDHQTATENETHGADYTRYIWDNTRSTHFLEILGSAPNVDTLNNGLHNALRDKNINNTRDIVVDVLQSAAPQTMVRRSAYW